MFNIKNYPTLKTIISENLNQLTTKQIIGLLENAGLQPKGSSQIQQRYLPILAHCRVVPGLYNLGLFDETKIPGYENEIGKTVNTSSLEKAVESLKLVAQKHGYTVDITLTPVEPVKSE